MTKYAVKIIPRLLNKNYSTSTEYVVKIIPRQLSMR